MKEGVESLGRVRAQAMVLLVIAFLAGAVVGGTFERVMGRPSRSSVTGRGGPPRGGPDRAQRGPGGGPGGGPGWSESIGLSADQRAKIDAILKKRSERVDSAWKVACLVIAPARDSSSKELDAVLTADQRAKRDSMRSARPAPRGGVRGGPFGCPIEVKAPAPK